MGYLFNIPSSRSAPSYTSPIIELYVPFPLLPYYGLTAMVSELLLALVALITLFLCVGNMAAGPACRMMCATVSVSRARESLPYEVLLLRYIWESQRSI
ncbi:hypothetical protein L211DRAFT_65776 [Terfezia boudieri ATCC MYA-4762]|uniref:Uncharacterized protein n=1 Tax=Terfezia boudieri ATCC MYA-4762 TaxID=1051890 RepID=A0A3N4LW57_9PEZI|nr:hypothetical protein L211DRAFT_65776 [Terfezia boudieri ATCC MYA-4762]